MKKSKYFFLGVVFTLIVCLSFPIFAASVSQKISVIINNMILNNNGIESTISVINYKNTLYVPINDILKIYNNISVINNNTIQINKITGKVKGTITWQYNKVIGTKGDTNATVFLFPKKADFTKKDLNLFILTKKATKDNNKIGIFSANVNGMGNYEISNVPVGEYYILIMSKNTIGDMTISDFDKERLSNIFSQRNYETLELLLKVNKYKLDTIDIVKGDATDYSYDFGFTSL